MKVVAKTVESKTDCSMVVFYHRHLASVRSGGRSGVRGG